MTVTSLNPEPRNLNTGGWQPSDDDHLIFQWVKMEGRTQQEVASMLEINQSTVSRVIQRYERWQAHLKDRENGRLDRHERLRAQRSLAYERNELIIASCLRIADKMEGFTELSKSTSSRPANELLNKREVRTEERVIDRHGVAARFLRLAYRINMEQLKLVKDVAYDTDAPAEPLTDEELAEQDRQAAEDAAELAAARQRAREWRPEAADRDSQHREGEAIAAGRHEPRAESATSTEYSVPSTLPVADSAVVELRSPTTTPADGTSAPSPQPPAPPLHNLHNANPPEITATATQPCTCTVEVRLEKNSQPCITQSTQARSASEGQGSEFASPSPDDNAKGAFACADPVRALE